MLSDETLLGLWRGFLAYLCRWREVSFGFMADFVPPQFRLIDPDGPLGEWATEHSNPDVELILDSTNRPPESKKARLGITSVKQRSFETPAEDRFGVSTVSQDELQILSKSYVIHVLSLSTLEKTVQNSQTLQTEKGATSG